MKTRRRRLGKLRRNYRRSEAAFYSCPCDDAIESRMWERKEIARLTMLRQLKWNDHHSKDQMLHREIRRPGTLTAFQYALVFQCARYSVAPRDEMPF